MKKTHLHVIENNIIRILSNMTYKFNAIPIKSSIDIKINQGPYQQAKNAKS